MLIDISYLSSIVRGCGCGSKCRCTSGCKPGCEADCCKDKCKCKNGRCTAMELGVCVCQCAVDVIWESYQKSHTIHYFSFTSQGCKCGPRVPPAARCPCGPNCVCGDNCQAACGCKSPHELYFKAVVKYQ